MNRLVTREAPRAFTNDELWAAIQPPSIQGIKYSDMMLSPVDAGQDPPAGNQDDPQEYEDARHISLFGNFPEISDSQDTNAEDDAPTDHHDSNFVGHPGYWESWVPVWGTGREAIADYQEGKYG